MTINFNTGPYFDDFSPDNNFYKILFKPGYAVQARELNQLQSILQNQVSSVGKHLFKKNTMVIPGGIVLNETADILYLKGVEDVTDLIGKTITNTSSFDVNDDASLDSSITAVVLAVQLGNESQSAAVYVKYFKTDATGRSSFDLTDANVYVVEDGGSTYEIDDTTPTSVGKVATISAGTFFTKEVFVDVPTQTIIVERDTSTITNCIVGLQITESIVTSEDDGALLDNANGSPNQYAPGADRYKIALDLVRLDAGTTIDDDVFIKMMEVQNNAVVYLNNKTEYAELMKTLARRTYDANGNFIVRGLDTSITDTDEADYVWVNITRGKCYLGGYEYEQMVDTPIAIEKPRGTAYQEDMPTTVQYSTNMPYLYIAGGTLIEEIPLPNSLVQLLNAAPGTSGAKVIGYGIFRDIQYVFGDVGTDDVYKIFVDNISLEKGYSYADIGGFQQPTTQEGAPVLHELRLANIIGTFTAGNNVVPAVPGSTQTGELYTRLDNKLYVIKDTLNAVPTSDVVKDATTGATGERRATFVTNFSTSFVPMVEVDKDTIKTLYVDDANTTSYSIIRRDVFNVTAEDSYDVTPLGAGEGLFEDFSTSDYYAFISNAGSETFVELTPSNIIVEGLKYTLVVPESSPMIGKTVVVYSTINKTNVVEAPKTLVTVTPTMVIPTPSRSWMALNHQDVQSLDRVVEGKVIVVTGATWATSEATLTAKYKVADQSPLPVYTHAIGDKVVVRDIASANNTTGAFDAGFNGVKTLTLVTTSAAAADSEGLVEVTVTMKYALVANPGTFVTPTEGTVALKPDITSDEDITSRYTLDSGNTAYTTETGMIKQKRKTILPQGQLGVLYKYYAIGTGNYISVDSYGDPSGDLGYIGEIDDVTEGNNAIEVRRYIDFRLRPSHYYFKNIASIASGSNILVLRDLNLSGRCDCLAGKYVVGPSHLTGALIVDATKVKYNAATGNTEIELNSSAAADTIGTYYIGLNGAGLSLVDETALGKAFQFPKDGTRFTYQYTKFKARDLLVYVDRQQDLLSVKYEDVQNLTEALKLRRSEFKLPLVFVHMEPYTLNIDEVSVYKFDNPVYQMLDIHNLRERLDRNEYYTSLALNRDIEGEILLAGQEESTTAAYGYWNENFMNLATQDFNNPDFACTIYDKSYASPGVVTRTVNLQFDQTNSTSTWAQTGNSVTLPFTESRVMGNNRASRSNNLNPYNTIQWTGKLKLNPSVDNWIDTTVAPVRTNDTKTATPTIVTPTVVQTPSSPTVVNPSPPTVVNQVPVAVPPKVVPVIPPPPVVTIPPPVLPPPPVEEIVSEITNLRTSWGPDTQGGYHAITFDWRTNLGRTGRVNTDMHLSSAVKDLGKTGYNGDYARSLINKKYNEMGVKEYLNAGQHFNQQPPSNWNPSSQAYKKNTPTQSLV